MSERERSTTSRGLPIVTRETYSKIAGADKKGSEPWGEMLNRVKERIIREQPILACFLEAQASRYDPETMQHMFELAIGLYALLEHQANINRMPSAFVENPEEKE